MSKRTEVEEIENFIRQLKVDGNGCHIWQGGVGTNGYGGYSAGGRPVLAHIYAWTLMNGPVPQGKILRHTCDNKLCCNAMDSLGDFESHIILGTHQQNMADKISRGRVNLNPRKPRRVTVADRDYMLRLSAEGATYYRIAKILGRDQATVKKTILKSMATDPKAVA